MLTNLNLWSSWQIKYKICENIQDIASVQYLQYCKYT